MNAREQIAEIERRVNASVIGQERVVERLVIALLANGNVLIEGLPGLAKTRAIKSLSKALESEFSRIQFTPDLLPSDVTGGEIYLSQGAGAGTFQFRQCAADAEGHGRVRRPGQILALPPGFRPCHQRALRLLQRFRAKARQRRNFAPSLTFTVL